MVQSGHTTYHHGRTLKNVAMDQPRKEAEQDLTKFQRFNLQYFVVPFCMDIKMSEYACCALLVLEDM